MTLAKELTLYIILVEVKKFRNFLISALQFIKPFPIIFKVSEALSFLHNSARMIHGNLSPESIVVNSNGAWKLAGLDFCIQNSGTIADVSFIGGNVLSLI